MQGRGNADQSREEGTGVSSSNSAEIQKRETSEAKSPATEPAR